MELASAKAVISGGASGLGFATAQRVIDAGGQVAGLRPRAVVRWNLGAPLASLLLVAGLLVGLMVGWAM